MRSKQQGSAIYGTSTLLSIITALTGSVASAQAPQAYAPAAKQAAGSIDASKCTDIKNSEALFKQEIMKRAREAQGSGFKPAQSYEGGTYDSQTATQRVESRANKQAEIATNALFAAITHPKTAAAAASDSISGDSKRRSTMKMFTRCERQDATPRPIIDNQYLFVADDKTCRDGGTPLDMGMDVSQVFQTNMPADKVMVRFARAKLTSTDANSVSFCTGGDEDPNCRQAASYDPVQSPNITPKMNRAYYFQDSMVFKKTVMGISIAAPSPMVNRTMMKISPVDVCGSKVYLITGYGNGSELGFDRSTLLGIIAPIGGKTVVIGNVSAQASKSRSWPISFAQTYYKESMESVFGVIDPSSHESSGGYAALAEMIGSRERPVMGEIGGIGGVAFAPGGGGAYRGQEVSQ